MNKILEGKINMEELPKLLIQESSLYVICTERFLTNYSSLEDSNVVRQVCDV